MVSLRSDLADTKGFRIGLITHHGLDATQIWEAIQPIDNKNNLTPLCKLIPYLAAWKPAWFCSTSCLERSAMMFMTAAEPGTVDFVRCLDALTFLIASVMHG